MVPKFRAWQSEHFEMCDVVAIDYLCDKLGFGAEMDISGRYVVDYWLPIDECVLMQSTGMHDKNGVEIFEGDITECKQLNAKSYVAPLDERVGVVVFGVGVVVFGKYVFSQNMIEYKVIGNIHEHSHLLDNN